MNVPLHKAARSGDLDTLKAMIAEGVDINDRGPSKWSLLIGAAIGNHVETVRWLLDNGATTESLDPKDGKNALHWAAYLGKVEVVHLLLERGFDANAADSFGGYAPLHLVAANARTETAPQIITALLTHGANIDARDQLGMTSAMKLLFPRKVDTLNFLLDRGADIDAHSNNGSTMLMLLAGHYKSAQMVHTLLERGARADILDSEKRTLLGMASTYGNRDMIQLLLDRGEAINHQDANGKTALMHAVGLPPEGDHRNIIIRLSPYAATSSKLVHEFISDAWKTQAKAVSMLLDNGADPSLCDNAGKTAMDWAQEQDGGKAVVEVLRAALG